MRRDRDFLIGAGLWVAAVAVGIWVRVEGLLRLPLFGDEYHTLHASITSYAELLTYFDLVGSHMALPTLQRLAQDLVGHGVLGMRLPAITPAVLTLLLLWPLGRHLVGSAPALVATLALALSPVHIFYSRFGRSYALTALLALLLVDAVRRATSENGARRHWAAVALFAALLPYVHLSSMGLVGTLCAAALWLSWRRARSARALVAPLAAFAAGGLLCALLFLPARESLLEYLDKIQGEGFLAGFGVTDVTTVLGGGRVAGMALLATVPVGALAMLVRRHEGGVLATAAIVGPLAAMLVFQPAGMAYAYARYLLVALPILLCVSAWFMTALVRGLVGRAELGDRLAVALGTALVIAVHLSGPRGPWQPDNGPYENTYVSLRRLPVFDVPYPDTPAFYRELARDDSAKRIIEAPPMQSRSILLYRNYYLQHGKETVFGLLTPDMETLTNGPYVRVFDRKLEESSDADYLIVHMNLVIETAAYWNWVYYHAWKDSTNDPDASFMNRHIVYLDPPNAIDPQQLRSLNRRHGMPVYQDETIRVWKLK